MTKLQTLPVAFDAYEISGVRRFGRGKNRYCERVPDDEAQFWSLYGHIPGQGAECIGDYKSREFAEEVYARIAGRHYSENSPKEAATISNLERASRCHWVIEAYGTDKLETNLIDFLCDARHWCDSNGECFGELDRIAHQHYLAELSERRGG